MTAQSPFVRKQQEKAYKRQVKLGVNLNKEVELSSDVLREALDPALSTENLWIPPFNATFSNVGGRASVLVPKKDAHRLYLMFLTPYYEDKLYAIAQPVMDEVNNMLTEFQEKGGVKEMDWSADLGDVVQGMILRLMGAVHDFNKTCAATASIIAEASVILAKKYKDEPITEEDYALVAKFSPEYFMENVPTEYIMRHIIMPQYKKTGIADLIGIFFSKLKDTLLSGVASLIPQATGLNTSVTQDSSKPLVDFQPSVTSTQEPN